VSCPSEEILLAYVDGVLEPRRRDEVETHIDGCVACGILVADAARDQTHAPVGDPLEREEPGEAELPFVPPASIGRYVVEEALGAGAMGYVFAAFDPELDRRVALKFVRPSRSTVDADRGRERLIREAQAIARLSHPNVVKVFEVVEAESTEGPMLCIVMELVKGESLRHWLATKPPRSAVLAAFEQAASGLAAAHDAGVVHRDFKPENVIVVDRDDAVEVKVMDFGLARARSLESVVHDWSGSMQAAEVESVGARPSIPEELTAAGTIMGTPRYMAPEQHRGEEADARSDQFAFCVALYETLYEQRAFSAPDYEALGAQKHRPRRGPPPRRRGVSTALASAVCTGLSANRDDRFADMRPLIAVIARARAPRSRARWVAAALVASIGSAGLLMARHSSEPCVRDADRARTIWSSEARRTIDAAFGDVQLSYADDALSGVHAGLDEYVRLWTETRVAVCEGAANQRERLLTDRQIACLDRQLPELVAAVDVLVGAEAATVKHALTIVQSLPTPTVCSDPAFVSSTVAPPDRDAVAREVLEIRRRLAHIVAHGRAGRAPHVLDEAMRVAEDADAVGYAPARAEAELVLGGLLSTLGRSDEAAARLASAYWRATEANDHTLAARAATTLVFVHGHQRAALDEGKRWARFAETALRRVRAEPAAWARYEYNLGLVLSDGGAHEEAIELLQRALDRYVQAGPGHEVARATTLNGIAGARARAGDLQAARAGFEQAVALSESIVGPAHPDTALALNNLGTVSIDLGDYDRAQTELDRALEVAEHALGSDHVSVGDVLLNRGRLHARRDRFDQARRDYLRAIEIWTIRLPPEHPSLAQARNNLGVVALREGNAKTALEHFDAALGSWEQALGPVHPRLVMALENRAEALGILGRVDEASTSLQRALDIVATSMSGADATTHRERIRAELGRVQDDGRRPVVP
jgi:eukaryotic-like serine/threonine-protein kinase